MSRRKGRKSSTRARRQTPKRTHIDLAKQIDPNQLARRERYFDILVVVALFAFGAYQSVLYFGHKVVPNPDFTAIFRVGRELLSFQIPTTFKIAPVVGLLQNFLSFFLGGQHPHLTAGWLLNALLHPFNLILLYLVGRQIVGKSALWIAIIAILNPWLIYMLGEPLMETSLLFFSLLTFYFILKRSKWCYLLASIASMVRYEGAALILAAFVMDMICSKSRRERIWAFLYSAAAAVPLALWLLGTILTWQEGTSHYLSVFFTKEYSKAFAQSVEGRTGIMMHMKLLWQVGFRPLLTPYQGAGRDFSELLWKLSKAFAVLSFVFGSVYGLCKRQWKILALLAFFIPYFVLHASYPYPLQRFHTNIFWIALLICWLGLQSAWKLVDRDRRVPRRFVLILQALAATIAVIWLFALVPHLPEISKMSPKSASVPYVAMVLGALIFAGRTFIYRSKHILRELSILALLCLAVVSNQFRLVGRVGDGQREKEFKDLGQWYAATAKPGEKLAVYMASVVRIFAPKYAEYIVGFPKADSRTDLVNALYENDVTYVVWATREGLRSDHTAYNRLRLPRNIGHLQQPRDVGPYQFITRLGSKRGFVNVFRLRKPPDSVKPKPPGS